MGGASLLVAIGNPNPVVTLTNDSVSDSGFGGDTHALAGYQVTPTGTVQQRVDAGTTPINGSTDWIIPHAFGSLGTYHVRVTATGDSPSGSALNTWLEINTTREWYIEQSGNGSTSCTLTVEISDDGGSSTLDSATISLSASVTP